jgi:non-specific riboncleoside hydrolase
MMGGGITKGNVPPDYIAEYNIALDPKSAAVVFDSRVPVTMIGIDATQYVPCTSKFKESVKDITPQGKIGTIIKSIIMNNTNDFSDFYDPLVSFYLSETSSFSSIKGKLESSCKTSTYGKTTLTQNSTKDTVITRVIPESFYSYLQTSLI